MTVDKNLPILVVDDYGIMRRIVCNLLRQLGFANCDEAADGAEALRKLSEKEYGLVLSDWSMQPMSGLDLLKQVRAGHERLPFIMVTAESKPESLLAAKLAGASSYIIKPFNADVLRTKLASVMEAA